MIGLKLKLFDSFEIDITSLNFLTVSLDGFNFILLVLNMIITWHKIDSLIKAQKHIVNHLQHDLAGAHEGSLLNVHQVISALKYLIHVIKIDIFDSSHPRLAIEWWKVFTDLFGSWLITLISPWWRHWRCSGWFIVFSNGMSREVSLVFCDQGGFIFYVVIWLFRKII